MPFLNAGDVYKWVTGVFSDGDYAEAHQLSKHPNLAPTVCYACHIWWGERFLL